MRMSNRTSVLAASLLVCTVVLYPDFAFAGASISISGGTWAIGTKGALSESQSASNAWTVTNDSGGTEDVVLSVSSTGAWSASTDGSQPANKFLLRKNNSSGQIITASNANLVTSLTNGGTHSLGLWFKAPPSGSEEAAHTLTVTLTATNWIPPCNGWYAYGYCWYDGANTCTNICSSHGGCASASMSQSEETAICQHWYPAAPASPGCCAQEGAPPCAAEIPGCRATLTPYYVSCSEQCCTYDNYGVTMDCARALEGALARQCPCNS